MPVQTIPPRIRWAVDLMDVQPADQVLEIGCGPGAGAEADLRRSRPASCSRSTDPSRASTAPSAATRSTSTPAASSSARSTSPPCASRSSGSTRSSPSTSNLFWVRACADEVALLHERVVPGGAVYLFYDASRPELVAQHREEGLRQRSPRRLPGLASSSRRLPAVIGIIGKR